MPGCFIPVGLENCYSAKCVLAVAETQCSQSTTVLSTSELLRVAETPISNNGAQPLRL